MKKLLCLLLSCLTVFCMFGCSDNGEEKSEESKAVTLEPGKNFIGNTIVEIFEKYKDASAEEILKDTDPKQDGKEFEYNKGEYFYTAKLPKGCENIKGSIHFTTENFIDMDNISITIDQSDKKKEQTAFQRPY